MKEPKVVSLGQFLFIESWAMNIGNHFDAIRHFVEQSTERYSRRGENVEAIGIKSVFAKSSSFVDYNEDEDQDDDEVSGLDKLIENDSSIIYSKDFYFCQSRLDADKLPESKHFYEIRLFS